MTPRQTIPLLLMAGLIVCGGGRREGGACGLAAGCLTPAKQAMEAAETMAHATEPVGLRMAQRVTQPEPATVVAVGRMGNDAAAMLAEQAAVQQVVKEAELDLTPEQWSSLAAVTGHYQTVRQAFEATLATVVGTDKRRLEIPAYPEAGDALREKFYGELRERLGEVVAEQIARRAGAALEGYFGGVGVGVQTLDFSPSAVAEPADYQVTRTARYWNSVEAREALTLRRETHFPAMEDPTGERWGPFLALLANRGAE